MKISDTRSRAREEETFLICATASGEMIGIAATVRDAWFEAHGTLSVVGHGSCCHTDTTHEATCSTSVSHLAAKGEDRGRSSTDERYKGPKYRAKAEIEVIFGVRGCNLGR